MDTYSLQLRDGLRTGLLVVPGALLRCLGSLQGGVSNGGSSDLQSWGASGKGSRRLDRQGGPEQWTYVTAAHCARFLLNCFRISWYLDK
jgi:hypothetical protein